MGFTPPFRGNENTEWGQRMEPEAVEVYKLLTGHDVESADIGVRYTLHVICAACCRRLTASSRARWPQELAGASWLGASPDGLILDGRGVLEVKCPAVRLARSASTRAEALACI